MALDLDATDDPLHGHWQSRFFHRDCKGSCYLPLDVFGGEHLLCAEFRPPDRGASAGAVRELARIVPPATSLAGRAVVEAGTAASAVRRS